MGAAQRRSDSPVQKETEEQKGAVEMLLLEPPDYGFW